jgi:conjugative relaxase-like TrwC/TraI family protein
LRRIPSRRRAGFDAVFAAPKSVSLLAALGAPPDGARLGRAHELAVRDSLGFLERSATWTRRSAEHRRIPTGGLIAAAFTHGTSWTGDPHLHTHVVVANLVEGADGRWSCLDSRALYRHAPAAGAIYQASLRHHVARQGLTVSWELRAGGLADIRGVPREAIDRCSVRRRQIEAEIRPVGAGSARGRQVAAGRTRREPSAEPLEPWQERAAGAGLDPERAAAVLRMGPRVARDPPPPAANAIERFLIERGSWFGRADTVRAVAGLLPQGAAALTVQRWADEFLQGALPIGEDRWTTPGLKRLEAEIVRAATDRPLRTTPARRDEIDAALARRPELRPAGEAAVRRLTSAAAVDLVTGANLPGTAAVLDAARAAWQGSGHRVAVAIRPGRDDARIAVRWQALSGLDPPPEAPRRATVLIVDRADRLSTADLHRILFDGLARNSKVVLLDGGTGAPSREPASPAFGALRQQLRAIEVPTAGELALTRARANEVVRGGRDRSVAVAPSPQSAAAGLVADWARAREKGGPAGPPVMVALGPQEADYLNAAARAYRQAIGELRGPALRAGGREFQAGDEVRALRRRPELGRVPAGTIGVVTAIDPAHGRFTVRWPAITVTLSATDRPASAVVHAYATTPAYARRHAGPLLALGDVSRLLPELRPSVVYCVAPGPPAHAPEIVRKQVAIGRAAEIRPTRAVVAALGPPPAGDDGARRAWREAAQAIEVHREGRQLPDEALVLDHRRADELRVAVACRAAERARTVAHELGLTRGER